MIRWHAYTVRDRGNGGAPGRGVAAAGTVRPGLRPARKGWRIMERQRPQGHAGAVIESACLVDAGRRTERPSAIVRVHRPPLHGVHAQGLRALTSACGQRIAASRSRQASSQLWHASAQIGPC